MKQLFIFLSMLPLAALARVATIASPNGQLVVSVSDDGGRATYSVSLGGQQVLLPSALGLTADFGDFTQGMKITATKAESVDKCYEMPQVKHSHMHYVATQMNVDFENGQHQQLTVQFSVSDNDIAFRYLILRQANGNPKSAVIMSEATAFCLPEGTTTFLTPQSKAMVGWESTKPSYEEEYNADAPMNVASQFGQGYTFPCLFKAPLPSSQLGGSSKSNKPISQSGEADSGLWILISETGVSSQYCGSHLSDYKTIESPSGTVGEASPGYYQIAFPMAGENNGNGTPTAGLAVPGATPWRTITVGQTLKPIVETTIAYDVVEPLYEPSQTYSYGRYTWSWLIWQDKSVNYDDQVQFIDLASAMGYELCLVDNWWDQQIGRDRIAELSAYAQSKGVGLMMWYNSNGYENNAPQSPRGCMDNIIARDREMAWLKSIGVKGIKVDFFGGDKQETMRLYEEILYDANRYGLLCIFHGCTLPRGWERMYPNFVASEAVLASENVYFNEESAMREPFDLCMHPFCRNAVATMDWGGVIMNRYMSRDNHSRHPRHTTDAFEIASAFTNQSAIQCVAMQPNNLSELQQVELDFLRTIPTTWDETRYVAGYPGRFVVLARRHGTQWYVAGLNATKAPLTLTLDLSDFNVTSQLNDQTDRRGNITGIAVTSPKQKKGKTVITMQPNGGIVLF